MNNRMRILLLALLAVLVMALAPVALGQDNMGLSDEDAQLLAEATAASGEFDSLAFDYSFDMAVSGIPDTEVALALTGTGLITADEDFMPVGAFTMTGTFDGEAFNFEFRLVDGIVYVNLDDGQGWQGMPLDSLLDSASDVAGVPLDPEALMSGEAMDESQMEAMGGAMMALATMDPSEYISMSRTDEGALARFTTQITLGEFLQSEEFGMAVEGALAATGDESMEGMGMMVGMLFQEAGISLDQYVNTETGLIDRASMTMNLAISPMLTGGEEPAVIDMMLDIMMTEYNPEVSIEAPEGATMIEGGM